MKICERNPGSAGVLAGEFRHIGGAPNRRSMGSLGRLTTVLRSNSQSNSVRLSQTH